MSETNVVAKNEVAERLLNYLIAYKTRTGERLLESNITIESIPLEDSITISAEN